MSTIRCVQRFLAATLFAAALPLAAQIALEPCHLKGIEREVRCGRLEVAENPAAPDGRKISLRVAVVPALAKRKAADPLFVIAGGPGQSATSVAAQMQAVFARINARRELVFLDQRGTGGSNLLTCQSGDAAASLREALDTRATLERLAACIPKLAADTRYYATVYATRDVDAVRAALGYERLNLWASSYGTRAALDYLRQFPQRVRSAVLDGVAPADMALPASLTVDVEAALEALLEACARDAQCAGQRPTPREALQRLFAGSAKGLQVVLAHPLTGAREKVTLDRAAFAGMLRGPLYVPSLAALLPHALARAGSGDFGPLAAMASLLSSATAEGFGDVMHFAVICAEDMPRIDVAAMAGARATRFGTGFIDLYRRACSHVPTEPAPAEFYQLASVPVPVLLLSGGRDPVTPPRHAEAVAGKLANARHLRAPHLGHGVSPQGCAPDLIERFVRQASFENIDGACLARLPAPPLFRPFRTAGR